MHTAVVDRKRSWQKLLAAARADYDAGRWEDTAAICERILQEDRRSADTLHLLGLVALQLGNVEMAARFVEQAIEIEPGCAVFWNSLGAVFLKQKNFEKAELSFLAALKRDARYADAHLNLGEVLERQGRAEEAADFFRRAIACNPWLAKAHSNLGTMLARAGRHCEAEACFRQALELSPEDYHARKQLAGVLNGQGRHREAIAMFRSLLPEHANDAELHYVLAHALHRGVEVAEAVTGYERALEIDPHYLAAYSNLLYIHASTRDVAPGVERELASGWERAALTAAERESAAGRKFARARCCGWRLRLGIVSAEFGEHAVAEFIEPVLENLDRSRFHVSLFPTTKRGEARTERMRLLADDWVPLEALSDAEAAEQVRSKDIDVLIDTTGHTANCRLGICAHRASPVQVSYIGYFGTTGLTEMDWVISDGSLAEEQAAYFREGVWRLGRFPACYRGDATLPESRWVPDPQGTIWLGSFNRYMKVTDETLDLWASVLRAIPNAKLLLEDRHIDERDAHARITSGLEQRGVVSERVAFEPHVPGHLRHMQLYDRLDVALDTVPYNSGTTACDALWMGVPVVALEGKCVVSRMCGGFLRAAGFGEWVAQDREGYARIVRELATDVEMRKKVRGSQRAKMARSELCDAPGLARELEVAFEGMFNHWRENQA
ncbi:MAG TPA: tetratricopeptide repeat protein [Candidatus Koribacter sp.]|jgi:predicted O-linked N-acetylglucosamine transferase (SPINDLY family)